MSDTIDLEIAGSTKTYKCPRHGKHKAVMHVVVFGVLTRVYCMHCYVEHLDKSGVKEMHEAERDK